MWLPMSLAVCINSGDLKKSPMEKCPRCGFVPKTDEEKAKSLILSLNYEIDGVYKGQTKERLLEVAELVKQKRFSFDQAEVDAVVAYAHKVLSVPSSTLLKDGFKWLLWPGVLLALMVCILIWRRH
jgi:hypothetical protein